MSDNVKEIKEKRWKQWHYFADIADSAMMRNDEIQFLPDFLSTTGDKKITAWLFREINNEPEEGDRRYWIEAVWNELNTRNIRKVSGLEFTEKSGTHNHILLLLFEDPSVPVAYGFLNSKDAVRLSAYFPRAQGVAGITGNIEFLIFDLIGDPMK
ncbi:MAG TPA: hypothetical protein PLA65_17915 [Spirochaetota bacterium]|nr:hypothetical protein [Spirochaetota bacterium]HPN13940.1 hypothetical protein [Spirochaetota bacterium]